MQQRQGPPPSPPQRKPRRRRDRFVVIGSLAVAAALASVGTFALAERDPEVTITSLGATADTYVVRQYPSSAYGTAAKLTAANWHNWNTESYLLFAVPPQNDPIVSARVELTFERSDHRPAAVKLRALSTTGWSEQTTFLNKPQVGEAVATSQVGGGDTLSLDVTARVRSAGMYAFALTNDDSQSVASVFSREKGAAGPRLVIGTMPGGGAPTVPPTSVAPPTTPAPIIPSGSPTATASPTGPVRPSGAPASPSTGVPGPGPGTPTPPPIGNTLCGASFTNENSGETYQDALKRVDGYYNGLEMVRIFYPGKPANWPGKLNVSRRPVVVSFKFPPAEVTAGTHDAYMRAWFAAAPRDQDVYWTYYHEPEQEIAKGEMSSAAYKAAWRRLRSLADQAGNDRLSATLILMGWSVSPNSGRNWRDYYPGKDVIQVLGWDIYNPPGQVDKGLYQSPAELYKRVVETSRAEELPFGIGETGSYLAKGDTGARRAAWLRSVSRHLSDQGALFVAYFDLKWPSGDFRLRDQASIGAWREFCS